LTFELLVMTEITASTHTNYLFQLLKSKTAFSQGSWPLYSLNRVGQQ